MRLLAPLSNVVVCVALVAGDALAGAPTTPPPPVQVPVPSPTPPEPPRQPPPPVVERLGEHRLRIGAIDVDLKKRELVVPGKVNDAQMLEFVANTVGGYKAYESALTLETTAAGFNLALIFLGVDKTRSVLPRRHFDPDPPKGDPLEIWVEWERDGQPRRARAEDLLWDKRKNATLPRGPWVYTGSVFLRDGRYLAEAHGVLIGFVHTPAPIIENPLPDGVGGFGAFVVNPALDLTPGTPIRLTVRALPR